MAGADEPLALAAKGFALLPIIVSDRAGETTKAVAHELADYLSRITGAKFQVQTGNGSRGIVLGTLPEFPNPSLDEPLAIRNTFDGKEAFAIRTERERLLLIGATELGASHAAFRLLEHLGCRWFFPAKERSRADAKQGKRGPGKPSKRHALVAGFPAKKRSPVSTRSCVVAGRVSHPCTPLHAETCGLSAAAQ